MREREDEWFGFEKLDVWQRAVAFSLSVYRLTRSFPREELFGLTSQPRRASASVALNIAEGTSRSSRKDQARFFEMSYGSLSETVTLLHIARGAELISEGQLARARAEIGRICRMLSGLKRSALEAS